MNTLTFKIVLDENSSATQTKRIHIIGTNIQIDYGDGTTTIQEPNTERIDENHTWTRPAGAQSVTWNITITGNITGLGDECLMLGSNVYDVALPEGLLSIGNYCLNYVSGEKLIIPSTVTSIGYRFLLNSSVKNVIFLTKNLATIGINLLANNTNLNSVKLPEGLKTLSMYSFESCTGLKTLEVPSTLTSFPNLTYSFTNVQLETLKMGGGPINNPPITENTKIIVPLGKLQDFLNHSSYPNDESRYDIYGKNLSEKIYVLGTHLAENLQDKNITANANEGLTTLANKMHNIDAPNYKELTYELIWNDNDNEYGFRPSQFPTLLLANNEVIGGCLLPQDDMTSIQNKYSYTTQVPESDLNGEEITYMWEPLMSPSAYTKQDTSSQNTHTTTMQIKNRRRLMIEPMYQSGESAIDAIIDICGKVTNNDDNSEQTIQFSDFKLENNKYVIDFFTTSYVQYSLSLKAIDGYNINGLHPTKIIGTFVGNNAEYAELNKRIWVVMNPTPPGDIDYDTPL